MKNKSAFINILPLILVGAIVGAIGCYLWYQQSTKALTVSEPSSTPQSEIDNWKTHIIKEINLTFKTPEEMEVSFESQKDEQTGVAYSHTLYVQKGSGGTAGYYQLYGLYQVGQAYTGSLEFFKDELDNAKEITVSGLPAISGQIKGERNRFVTHILMPGGRFSLFTAEPTEENRLLTERILETFEFTENSQSSKACITAGCSGQLCVDEAHKGAITTCEFLEIYACTRLTKCERQNNGKCGWTPNEEYLSCIEGKS